MNKRPIHHPRRIKKFLRVLWDLQVNNQSLPGYMLWAAKYLFRTSKLCNHVTLVVESNDSFIPLDTYIDSCPVFIISQLKAQHLTEGPSVRIPTLPVAALIQPYLPADDEPPVLYPTLFSWHCAVRHRTYHVFAFIVHNMPARRYSIEELKALRQPSSGSASLKFSGNPEVGPIIRGSSSESSDNKAHSIHKPRHWDESSVASEEVLFKGNASRRAHREATKLSQTLRETKREATLRPVITPQFVEAPSTANEGDWVYRGRTGSDVALAEPISAPGGEVTQANEGFRRFYKAVVSPTHVRVTAGGRIVPNTRGPPSPTAKRSKETGLNENQGLTDKTLQSKPSLGQMSFGQPSYPVMTPYFPGCPPGFQAVPAGMQLVPLPYGQLPPGFQFVPQAYTPTGMGQMPQNNMTHNKDPNGAQSAASGDKVKITPPEFFDPSKPFMFNGQYFMPTPPGATSNQMATPPAMGVSSGVTGNNGHLMPQYHGRPGGPMGAFSMSNPGFQGPTGAPGMNHPGFSVANYKPPPIPPVISSIKPSDITKKQIAGFKQSLKYHEDQLQYNRHQIDEKEMEAAIQNYRELIRRFEDKLRTELEYEQSVLGQAELKDNATTGSQTPKASKVDNKPAAAENKNFSQPMSSLTENQLNSKFNSNNAPSVATEDDDSQSDMSFRKEYTEVPKMKLDEPSETFEEFQKRVAHLPPVAAAAPDFYPSHFRTAYELEKARMASDRRLSGLPVEDPIPPPPIDYVEGSDSRFLELPRRDHMGYSGSKSSTSGSNYGVPYLLGALPKHINPRHASPEDYVYTRPLTQDELRARWLYLSDAPKDISKGLPKYDGKHFYPAASSSVAESTVPESTVPDSPHMRSPRSGGTARPDEYRLTRSDPFRPCTPFHRGAPASSAGDEDDYDAKGYDSRIYSQSDNIQPHIEGFHSREPTATYESRESSLDAHSLALQDRQAENVSGGAKLWPDMLKKSGTSSALSSATATGWLPAYQNSTMMSFPPSNDVSRRVAPSPDNDCSDGGAMLAPVPEKRGENRPLQHVSSLDDQFKNMTMEASDRRNINKIPAPFNL
ncbi:hypothetical protein B0T20DRAFT_487738 [Sordaria brevicollis]|uniref:Uncharacterized protein n=1 Tax=Sordaria brevicollis TaxID=83679 RepID=A0AAE0P2Y8_SORBR|nr:hypothetical protein B0T20DRAFT_487738 [Sordaria brevicollis]